MTKKEKNWRKVLWQEWKFCNDKDYAKYLRRILFTKSTIWFYGFTLKQQPRPYAIDIETALKTACERHGSIKFYWQKRLEKLNKAKKKTSNINKLIANLKDHHWFERFISRHVLVYRGGDAIKSLLALAHTNSPKDYVLAEWLILSICEDTKDRLAEEANQLLCPFCITRCRAIEVSLPQLNTEYYGCYNCGQSIDFETWPTNGIVAILDNTTKKEKIKIDNQIRINWLHWQKLFDFDCVEIIQATDEQVERFAVKLGNDTDKIRASRYKNLLCTISPNCQLSKNTRRILEYTFGQVRSSKEDNRH